MGVGFAAYGKGLSLGHGLDSVEPGREMSFGFCKLYADHEAPQKKKPATAVHGYGLLKYSPPAHEAVKRDD